jgi:hypothetical protein
MVRHVYHLDDDFVGGDGAAPRSGDLDRPILTILVGPHPEWSKNSCDTRIVILEKAAETLPTLNRLFTCRTELARVGKQQNVSLALVIPFPMIMFCELG